MLVLSTLLEPYGVTVARLTLDQFAKVRILVRLPFATGDPPSWEASEVFSFPD